MAEPADWSLAPGRMPLPVLRVRLDGVIEQLSAAAARLFGRAAGELRSTPLDRVLSAGGRMLLHTQPMPALRVDGQASGLTLVVRDAARAEHTVLAHAALEGGGGTGAHFTLLPSRAGRRTEDELLRISRAADSSPGMLFGYVVDASGHGRFAYAGAAIVGPFGPVPEQLRADDADLLARLHADDLVLMDVQMPELDGPQATRELWRPIGDGLAIVAMTANAFGEDRRACLQAGMNDHVGKPVDPESLYATLLRWLPPPAAAGATPAPQARQPGLP